LPAVAEIGRAEFTHPDLTYFDDINAISGERYDAVICAQLFNILEQPLEVFGQVETLQYDYLIINRFPILMPFSPEDDDRVTILESTSDEVLSAPIWFFSPPKWETRFDRNHSIKARWLCSKDGTVVFDGGGGRRAISSASSSSGKASGPRGRKRPASRCFPPP
jgi:hypothetical protein